MRTRRIVCAIIGPLVGVVIAGCTRESTAPQKEERAVVDAAAVTANVAAQLTSDGRFADDVGRPAQVDGMTIAQAERLARLYLRDYGSFAEEFFSQIHGSRVRVDRLRICRPTYFAEAQYAFVDTLDVPRFVKESLEGHFLVSFCPEGQRSVAVVSRVAPSAKDYERGGEIWIPEGGGRGLGAWPLAPGRPGVIDPADAVARVFGATRTRIASVPRLIRSDPGDAWTYARWVFAPERPVAGMLGAPAGRPIAAPGDARVQASVIGVGNIDDPQIVFGVLAATPAEPPGGFGDVAIALDDGSVRSWRFRPVSGAAFEYRAFSASPGGGAR